MKIKKITVNISFLTSIFNNYCLQYKNKCYKKATKTIDKNTDTSTTDSDTGTTDRNDNGNNNNHDNNYDVNNNNNNNDDNHDNNNDNNDDDNDVNNNNNKEQNKKTLNKENQDTLQVDNNEEYKKIKEIINKLKEKKENLNNITESNILTSSKEIENSNFYKLCYNLLNIVKESDYLDKNAEKCSKPLSSDYDNLIKTHKKLSTDNNYYKKYVDIVKIYTYYFLYLKDLYDLKSKVDENVTKLRKDISNLNDNVFNNELDNTLKQINDKLSYYSFIKNDSLDKIIKKEEQKVTENNKKIDKIKEKLINALSSAKTNLEQKQNDAKNKIKNIEEEINNIKNTIKENEQIIKSKLGMSPIKEDETYQTINKEITKILKKITDTNQFIYVDSYNDNNAVINKFNSLKPEIINNFKADINYYEIQINYYYDEIKKCENTKNFNSGWYWNQIYNYKEKIDESKNKIYEIETNLPTKINEEMNKEKIGKESQVIFHIGLNGIISKNVFDKLDNKEYNLEKIPSILTELRKLLSSVSILFLSNYYLYSHKYFNYSPEKFENETGDNYKKRVEDIKKDVNMYFEKFKINYNDLNKDKNEFNSLILNLKNESELAFNKIKEFFIKKDDNDYCKEFVEKRQIYFEIIEGLGTQYYALKDFYDTKFNEFTSKNTADNALVNTAKKNINDNQYKLSMKDFELKSEVDKLEKINNSLRNLDNCSKNIIIENKETGEKEVNNKFSSIYYFSTGNYFKYDNDYYMSFIKYNESISIVNALKTNRDKIEKAISVRNEKIKNAKKLKAEKENIIKECNSISFYNFDIEQVFKNIIEKINNDNSIDEIAIKMYFEKTILCGTKALIDKKNGACSYSCSNKTCYEELNTFLTNSKIEETYNAIVDIFSNSIKNSSSYPSFTKGF